MYTSNAVLRETQLGGDIQIIVSDNHELKAQYHDIYEREFSLSHGLPQYRHIEDVHDQTSRFILVLKDLKCIGGARLSYTTASSAYRLPIEMTDLYLPSHFPDITGENEIYGQLGRLCIHPDYRDGGRSTQRLMRFISDDIRAVGITRLFGTAVEANFRLYRINCAKMGLPDIQVHKDIALPIYPMCGGIKFLLFSGRVSD